MCAKQIQRKKWILYRHTQDFDLLCKIAQILKAFSCTRIDKNDKKKLNYYLKEKGLYHERNEKLPLDAISHKINQLSYYMFGYQTRISSDKRFMFSPLGNLILKYIENQEKRLYIFITMLWGVQYPHPHGGSEKCFQLFPFRLIFRLLCDKRLEYKLYAYEVAYFVVFEETVTEDSYEKLIDRILLLRSKKFQEIASLFLQDEHTYVNSIYEWDYYVTNFFKNAGILEKTMGQTICKLRHGNTNTFRKVTSNYVSIPYHLRNFILDLNKEYPFTQQPLDLFSKTQLKIEIVKEIYSFCPRILLKKIGEEENNASNFLELPKLIEKYSNNLDNKTADKFEDVLVDGFNMFYNVEAKKISGAGHTDIECLYITKSKKFAVEAKSTSNKLLAINTSRLREHRNEIGAEYTIIITPRYVPAAKRDIVETNNVIILANTFAEYLYNCIINDMRDIDYSLFDEIIKNNLGKDISIFISNLSISTFGIREDNDMY